MIRLCSQEQSLTRLMSTIRPRKATPGDLAALVDLEFSAFSSDRISRRSWRDLISSASAQIIVATRADAILGSTVLLTNARTSVIRIYSLAVAAAARQQGVGRLLLAEAIQLSRNTGSALRLETRADNAQAQRLFEATGFVPFGRVDAYYADGMQAIRYQRMPTAAAPLS